MPMLGLAEPRMLHDSTPAMRRERAGDHKGLDGHSIDRDADQVRGARVAADREALPAPSV